MDTYLDPATYRGMSTVNETRLLTILQSNRRLKVGIVIAVALSAAAIVFAALAYFNTSFDTLTVRHLDIVAGSSELGEDAALNIQLDGTQSQYSNTMAGIKITMPGGGQNVSSTKQTGVRVQGGQTGVAVSGVVGSGVSITNDVSQGTPVALSVSNFSRDTALTDSTGTSVLGTALTQQTVLDALKTATLEVTGLNVSDTANFDQPAVFHGGLASLSDVYFSMLATDQTQTFTPDVPGWYRVRMNETGAFTVYPNNNAGVFLEPGTSTANAQWDHNIPSADLQTTPAWLSAVISPSTSGAAS